MPTRRNPPWTTDELLLALDLYLNIRPLLPGVTDARVTELSQVLNRMELHTARPDAEHFRNPNGVVLKLANFAALDEQYEGKGMQSGGAATTRVWERFSPHPDEVAKLAKAIRAQVGAGSVLPEDPEEEGLDVDEGRILFRQHRLRERNPEIVRRKKESAEGDLRCEICGFDFESVYGPLGIGYIECHHRLPLAEGTRITRLHDLALICSNCHRMVHRQRPWATIDDMRTILRS